MKKLPHLVWLISVLFLGGCFNASPSKESSWENFIPKPVVATTFEFPKNCEWKTIAKIVDGDTLYTNDRSKVRFLGINTPEMRKKDELPNADGLAAKQALETLIQTNQKVCLMFDPQGDQKDRYGRLLAYLFTQDGQDINKHLIATGFAEYYQKASYSRKKEFKETQKKAQHEKAGLWKDEFIIWR